MFLEWDDDEVTRIGNDSKPGAALPNVQPFNPRIRIIGMAPLVEPGQALQGPLPADAAIDNHKTRKMAAVRPARPLPPPRRPSEPPPAALVDTSEALPLADADLEVVANAPSSSVSVSPIVSLDGPDEAAPEPPQDEPETIDTHEAGRRPSHTRIGYARIDPERPQLCIAPLPAPVPPADFDDAPAAVSDRDDISHVRQLDDEALEGLDWSDHENGTQPLLEVGDGELPADLHAALAHEPPPDDEPLGHPLSLPSWEEEDDVTMPQRFVNLQQRARELALAYRRRHGTPDSDTLIEARPPRVIVRALDEAPRSEIVARGDDAPPPSAPCEAMEPPVDTSVEIDLSHLEQASPPSQPEPPREDDIEAPPPAHRPASLPSIMPMTISEPPAAPPRRGRKGWLAAGVLAVVSCAAVAGAVWLPREGALEVRLRTADGHTAARAEIFVDGQKHCDTDPCVIDGLAAGAKTVKVIVPGVADPQVATAEVVAGERHTLWVDIPSRQGVRVASSQSGVRLSVDGTARGTLPVELTDLRAGGHTLTFEREGHAPLTRRVQVAAGEIVDLGDIHLTPSAPAAVIDLHTEGAHVMLTQRGGSKQVLTGPWPMKLELAPGAYHLAATARGHAAFEHRFEVEPGDAPEVDVTLEPLRRRPRAAAADTAEAAAEDFDPYDGLD